jgi:hypothetical protein
MIAVTGAYAGCYVPDVCETFQVTKTWEYRRWQWKPFPWYYRRVINDTQSYRVSSWMRQRPPRPEPRTEQEAMVREILDQMMAEDRLEGRRLAGPDRVPLEWCRREDAEYVSAVGVAGTIQRICDVQVTGRVNWSEQMIQEQRHLAELSVGEPLT